MTPVRTKQLLLPRLLRILGVLGLIAVGVWYVAFQARHLITGPEVTLLEEPGVVSSERIVHIQGQTYNVTALSLNGQPIVTDPDGIFNVAVVLPNGYTTVSIDARDRYGRTTHLERSLVYSPAEDTSENELSLLNYK